MNSGFVATGEITPAPPLWVMQPILSCFKFVTDELQLCGTVSRALTVFEGFDTFLQLAMDSFIQIQHQSGIEGVKKLLSQHPYNASLARSYRESEFALLHGHSLVSIWAALETAIEDTAIVILMSDEEARIEMTNQCQKNALRADQTEEVCRALLRKWEQSQQKAESVGHRFERVLVHFGMSADLSSELANKLTEINALRNCLMHRGGLIDERAVRESSSLLPMLHTQIIIGKNAYDAYHRAVSDYMMSVMRRISTCRYIKKSN